MPSRKCKFSIVTAAIFCLAMNISHANEGEGRIKLGYIFTDEEGNLAVNQETYNLYDGFNFSLEDWRYILDNGVNLNADLRNISLENRNLNFSSFKARLFSLSLFNNKYRRIYSANGSRVTKRESFGGRLSVIPWKHVTLFGGYKLMDKAGDNLFVFQQPSTPTTFGTDYTHHSFNIGAKGFYWKSSASIEYRASDLDDKINVNRGRDTETFRMNASSAVPKFERVVLSGGYDYRRDELETLKTAVKTNQGWGATKVYLPEQFMVDYRLVFARTLHNVNKIETDNVFNTVSVSKRWNRFGGLRVGYENRIVDDLIDRSESHSFLFSGWLNYRDRLFLKTIGSTRDRDIVTGSTYVGDEDFTRFRVGVKYTDDRWGDLSTEYQGRYKENDDINSKVDYNTFSTRLNLTKEQYGRLTVIYAYYLGEYSNAASEFEFSDNMVTATITPVSIRDLSVSVGGTYYRSRRNLDIEKSNLHFTGSYTFLNGYQAEATYSVFNYDDFTVINEFYTGNVFEIYLVKDLSIRSK